MFVMSYDRLSPKLQRVFAYALLLVTMVIWASAFAGLRRVLEEVDAYALTTVRMVIAALSLGVVGALMRVRLPARGDLVWIMAAGVSGFSLYHLMLNLGLVHVTAGQGSFIIATTPLWTLFLAMRFLGERLTWVGGLGVLMSVGGVAAVSISRGDLAVQGGALFVLCAALCAAVNMILQKRLLERYGALELSIYVTLAGALPFLLYVPWCADQVVEMSGEAWWVTLYLGVGPIGVGYVLSTMALKILPASRSAQMMLLVPPITALIAWVWLGEVPTLRMALGGALILLGVVVSGLGRLSLRTP